MVGSSRREWLIITSFIFDSLHFLFLSEEKIEQIYKKEDLYEVTEK